MKGLRYQPLRRQLAIAIVLMLVPVVVAAGWAGMVTLRERSSELTDQVQLVTRTTAAYIQRDIVNLDVMVDSLSRDPSISGLNGAGTMQVFERAAAGRPAILRLVLADRSGGVLAEASMSNEPLESGPWISEVVQSGRRVVEPIRFSPTRHLGYVVMAYPVRRGSETVGALALFVNLSTLQDAFVSLPLPQGSVINVIDQSGRILARSTDSARYSGRTLFDEPRTPGTLLPAGRRVGVDGVPRIYAEAPVDAGPWVVSIGIPAAIAFDRAESVWARGFSVLAIGLVGCLFVAFLMSRRFAGAVVHLDDTAKRIAAGDFSPIERHPMVSQEFSDLQDAFDAMLRRFNETRAALDAQMAEERRIRQELESLQGQVIRQERLAAVGQLVSGVAHEINNPLQAILGFAELLQIQPDVPNTIKNDLRLIQKESARACGIIRNLAMFARQQPGEAAAVSLRDVIRSVAELRQRRLESEDIELIVDDRSSQHVMAVLTELQQVVLNFVVNAEQSILSSGRLPGRITIRTFDVDGRAVLEVEDTGPGIPPEHETRLFQPFFTTKPVGQGTGLGLSVSYGIIDSLGGQIGYRNAAAGGAIFYFNLPAVVEERA
ncbi:MAG TPA: ATP-binding protein [Vicinamibacterales bacterium]|nr:ATP-binding protein [Vicinamibacterales bacterium]